MEINKVRGREDDCEVSSSNHVREVVYLLGLGVKETTETLMKRFVCNTQDRSARFMGANDPS